MAAVSPEYAIYGATNINLRNVVPADDWHDEIHPNDRGFGKTAAKLRAAI
ncbi:hypothetical protein [Taklimakanibacter deserti]